MRTEEIKRAHRYPWEVPTTEEIVAETVESFSRQLDQILKPKAKEHNFRLEPKSGMHICMNCGKGATKRNLVGSCKL